MTRLAIAGLGIVVSMGLAGGAYAAAGTNASVTGTLEDSYCYMTMGAHGASHKKCATECAEKGIPVSLVEKGDKKIYVLLPPKNNEPLPKDVIAKMEEEVTVSGKQYSKGGVNYLTVESIK
jgi:hypothetical protein